MAETGMRHPRIITSLTIVRNRSEFVQRSAIRSVAHSRFVAPMNR